MDLSNRIHTKLHIILCALYWVIVFPVSHFQTYLDDTTTGSAINLATIIFVVLVISNCLWYLNRNLIIHRAPVVRNMLIAFLALAAPLLLNASQISHCLPLVLPFLISAAMLFSLHQIRYNMSKRNLLLLLILAGTTVNAILHDATFVMQYNISTPPADGTLSSIGIVVSLYLLLRSRYTAFDIIGNLFALIILYLYFLHHISVKVLFVLVPSFLLLMVLMFRESLRTAFAVTAVLSTCTWIAYTIGFFSDFDPATQFSDFASNTMAHVKTAMSTLWAGHGNGSYAMANLEVNPNYYTERAYSTVLHLIAIGGITAAVPLFIAWYALLGCCISQKTNLDRKLSNLSLILPFILATMTANVSVFSMPVFFAMCTVIWYVSCQSNVTRTPIKWQDLKIRRVPIVIFMVIGLSYGISGLVTLKQFDAIRSSHECDMLNEMLLNPLVISNQVTEYEMTCVYEGLTILPVTQWLEAYRRIVTTEIIPYRPKKVFFEQLITLEEHYTPEERKEIRDLADRLYPGLAEEVATQVEADRKKKEEELAARKAAWDQQKDETAEDSAETRDTGAAEAGRQNGEEHASPDTVRRDAPAGSGSGDNEAQVNRSETSEASRADKESPEAKDESAGFKDESADIKQTQAPVPDNETGETAAAAAIKAPEPEAGQETGSGTDATSHAIPPEELH